MKFISLRRRIVLPLFASLLSLFFIFQALNEYNARYEAERSLINHIHVLNAGVEMNLEAAVLFEDQETALEVLNTFSADPNVHHAILSLKDQPNFARYGFADDELYQVPIVVEQRLTKRESLIYQKQLFSRVAVKIDGEQIGELTVIVDAKSLFDWSDSLRQAIFFLAMCLLTGLLLFYRIKTHVITPVDNLNSSVRHLGKNDQLWKPVVEHANDELGHLVRGFNTMGAEIRKRGEEIADTLAHLEQEKAYAIEVIESAQYALLVADREGNIKLCNIKALQLFCESREKMEGNLIGNYLHLKENKLQNALSQKTLLDGLRTSIINRSGEERELRITSSELPHIGLSLFTIEDVTEQEIHIQRQRLMARVFENSQDGLLVLNKKQQITMTNPAFVRLLGYSEVELVGKSFDDIKPWHQLRNLLEIANENLKTFNIWQGELWEEHKKGRSVPLSVKANQLKINETDEESELVLIISDISNVKEVERLEYLAHHDSLTGLGNRAQLYSELESIISRGKLGSFALIYMDLDGFKLINDNYGHVAGDVVLKEMSVRLLKLVRNKDLVVRLGGDEFVIVQRHTDNSGAVKLAKRVLNSVAEPILFEGIELKIGVSVGVHMTQKNRPETSEEMLRTADKAMYSAKAQGKGKVVNLFHA